MIPSAWLEEAARRLRGRTVRTPLTYDPEYKLYLKWENRQMTGSFKIRGALNKVLSLEKWELDRGLVTASAGNHGQGVAYAARLAGVPVIVFASNHAVPAKIDAMRALGAQVELVEGGYAEAEQAAVKFASQQGTYISPYNDGQVIAGQSTLMMEVFQQGSEMDPAFAPEVVTAPAGGGGLVAGIGAALADEALSRPVPRLIAVQSVASAYLYTLYHHGMQAEVIEF